MRRLLARLFGRPVLPETFGGRLAADEYVVAVAELARGGHLVLTQRGLWVPDGDAVRRIGWEWISKAVWDRSALVVTESVADGDAGDAVVLRELPPRRFVLARADRVPEVVRERVTGSIRSSQHRDLPGGGAWFVQRKVPGRDGVVLQVRPDPGTQPDVVRAIAAAVAARMPQP